MLWFKTSKKDATKYVPCPHVVWSLVAVRWVPSRERGGNRHGLLRGDPIHKLFPPRYTYRLYYFKTDSLLPLIDHSTLTGACCRMTVVACT